MGGCGTNSSNINKTFIIKPQSLTGGTPTISACTTLFTDMVQSCSGDTTLQMSTGLSIFNSDLLVQGNVTGQTFNAATYLSGNTNLITIIDARDNYVTGGTFDNSSDIITLNRRDGSNVSITGVTDFFVTGVTFSNDTITLGRNDGVQLSATGITDNFTTGGTLVGSVVYFDRNDALSAYTVDLSALDVNDTFVTGATISTGNTLTLTRNDAVEIDVDLSSIGFSGGSGSCIADLYVTNIYGCSPINLNDVMTVGDSGSPLVEIAGALNISGTTNTRNILPEAHLTYDIGAVGSRYDEIFVRKIRLGTSTTEISDGLLKVLGTTGFTMMPNGALTISGDTIPASDLGYKLGYETQRWLEINSGTGNFSAVTANTIDANLYTSGGTDLMTIINNSNTDNFTTGSTLIGSTLYFDRSNILSAYTADLSPLLDDTNFYVTAGTVVGTSLYLDRTDTLSAVTIDVSSFFDNTDNFTTGATLIGTTAYFDRTDGLSAYTMDLSALQDDTNTFVTGSTLSGGTNLVLTRNDAVEIVQDLSSFLDNTDNFTTGATLLGETLYFDRTDGLSAYTADLSSLDVNDTFISGMTFNTSTFDLTIGRNDGASFTESLAILASDVYVLSGIYTPSTGIVTYTNSTGGTFDVTGFTTGMTDSYTTGATLVGNSVQFDNNIQGTNLYSVDLSGLLLGPSNISADTFVSAATLNGTDLDFDRNGNLSAFTVDLSSFLDNTDNFTTGTSIVGSTVYFDRTDTLSAYTIDLGSVTGDTFVTSGLYTKSTGIIDLTRNDTGVVSITGVTDFFATGGTLVGTDLYIDRNDTLSAFTVDLSALQDNTNDFTTGATVIGSTAYFDRTDSLSAYTLDLSSFLDNTDNFTTGTTLVGGTLYFDRTDGLSAYTADLSSLIDDTNFYVTGGTIIGTSMYLDRNDTLSAATIDVSSLLDNTDTFVTGSTLSGGTNLVLTRNDAVEIVQDLSSFLDDTNDFTTGATLVGSVAYFDRTNGLSAYTLDLSSFISTGDTYVTAFTYNNANVITIDRNQGLSSLSVDISQLGAVTATSVESTTFTSGGTNLSDIFIKTDTNDFTTGTTLVGSTLYFDRTDGLSAYTADLSSFLDDTNFYVTAGTVVGTSMYLDRTDTLSAVTIDVSSLIDNTDTFSTGATLIGTTAYFDRNDVLSAYTLDLSSLVASDVYVTGATVSATASTLTLTRNDDVNVVATLTGFTSGGFTTRVIGPRGVGKGAVWADEGFLDELISVTLFDSNATEKVLFDELASGNVNISDGIYIAFTIFNTSVPVSGSSDTAYFELEARYYANGDQASKTADETLTSTITLTGGTTNTRQTTFVAQLDDSLISENDIIGLKLTRIPSNGADNYNADVALSSAWVIFKEQFVPSVTTT